MSLAARWSAIRRGRGDLPPIVDGLQFFGDLSSPSTSIVSGAVATLGDASGNGRNFTQSTGANRPTYNASDANFGGRPSMTFNGTTQFLSRAALQWPGTSLTVFYVFRATSVAPSDQRIFGARAGATSLAPLHAYLAGASLQANIQNPASVSSNLWTLLAGTVAANTTYRGCVTFDITSSSAITSAHVNGAASGSLAGSITPGAAFSSVAHGIGGTDVGGNLFAGNIVDPIVYAPALTATQIAQVDAWLRWRNGL